MFLYKTSWNKMQSIVPEKYIYFRDVGGYFILMKNHKNNLILKCCELNNSQLTLEQFLESK